MVLPFKLKRMAVSKKQLIELGLWLRLIQSLPEGIHDIPGISPNQYDTLKSTCYRENRLQKVRRYDPSARGGRVVVKISLLS